METVIKKTVFWIRDQVKKSGLNGVLVGVSGGIDSAVVTHLIKKACPDHSLGVIMPCKSHSNDQEDAAKVIQSAAIDSIVVDLSDTHDLLYTEIMNLLKEKNTWSEKSARLSDGNLRARLRMSTLYTIASHYGYLVAGTDNAAEWYTGYFTKYGDGGVDLVPLIHFTKGQVFQVAKVLGIPEEIIYKKPSAGLWEGQTDENEMGITYDKIDAYIEGKKIPEEDRVIIERLHELSKHKRTLAAAPPDFF